MEFGITQTVSLDITSRLKILNKLTQYLEEKFSLKDFGNGVKSFIVGVNCVSPEMLIPPRDFDTGFLLAKKYTKSKGTLVVQVKLNYGQVAQSTEDGLLDIVTEALLKTYPEVEKLNIKNFDIGKFYDDLKSLLNDRTWLAETGYEKQFHYKSPEARSATSFSASEKMPEGSFWEIIEQARIDSDGDLYKQVENIINVLSKKAESEIIGFECTLRELIMRAYHYNVMAVQKIVEGSVTDDSFLYFRCKLILRGRKPFENAINDPNNILEWIDPTTTGEPLLSVADKAFEIKFGNESTKVFPRDYASKVIDYDYGEYEIQGKDWTEEDIHKRYFKLWKAYNK